MKHFEILEKKNTQIWVFSHVTWYLINYSWDARGCQTWIGVSGNKILNGPESAFYYSFKNNKKRKADSGPFRIIFKKAFKPWII